MAGNFTGKTIAAGQLSNTVTSVYQSPVNTVTYLKDFNLYNNSATTQSITLYKNLGGNNYPWHTLVLNSNESADILDEEPLVLSALDSVQGLSNTANTIIFTLSGVQET